MCSSLNIPARAVVGLIIHKQNGKYFYSFHQWVELLEGSYWIPYYPTFGTRGVGLNYIKLIEVEKKIDFLKLLNALNINLEIMEVK
jgi:transglutaminase-like putative cysteine protease